MTVERRYVIPAGELGDGWTLIARAPMPERFTTNKDDNEGVTLAHNGGGDPTWIQWDEAMEIARTIIRAHAEAFPNAPALKVNP